ncbi:MAG: transcriptional regulator with XRE-family HTH domain [Pseudohongiellaceae bacterium]|jgi:transcriptional regulator with XRE-family HTH domain
MDFMKYLKHFNQQLRSIRISKKLTLQNIGDFCLVDTSIVEAWESDNLDTKCYPTLDNVLDLCFKTGMTLDYFIQFPNQGDVKQLNLPGLAFSEEVDLSESLKHLDEEIERLIPSDDEQELLKRYRESDEQNKELILELMAT